MKLLLIKAGKAFKTIQRDGIWRGGKRVIGSFFAMFAFVSKGQILFVTGGVGDSARYRTKHVSEELELNGFKCSVTIQDNPFLSSHVENFSVFVFHRVLFSPSVKKMIEKIKAQKKTIIFETDDLVHDPKYLEHMDYFKVMNSLEKKLYENGVGGEILNDPYVEVATTTTNFLAEKLREAGKKVFVVPNKLSKHDVEIAASILEAKKLKPEKLKAVRIGYFSGALSHNKDFATVTKVLKQLMEKHQNVELFLVGPLDIESELNVFGDRIKQFPYVTRDKHFANVASVDINIAPLEIDNPFCQSKSELKFFEAGIVNVPTVAAATAPFLEAINEGIDGFTANGEIEWTQKLEKLITNKQLRLSMGKRAHEKAIARYTTEKAGNEEYYKYLRECLKNN